uniref:Uncharacterized protein n=1 Tax=Parvoviridae sp. TaxID=1940570 RepID=A0A893A6F7_9VIRU|nr:MAG: hypothetical protein 4 [Parvoviridae sp.]
MSNLFSSLLDEPVSKKKFFEVLPEQWKKSSRWLEAYDHYVRKFKLMKHHVLRYRRINPNSNEYSELEEDILDLADEELIELSELSPSVVDAAVPATVAAGAVGTSSTGVGTTLTLGSILVASGAVGGTVAATSGGNDDEEDKDPIITLPEHKFLGPGNTVNDKVAHDLDDEFARVHDILYANATTQQDISDADEHFLFDTVSDIIDNGNYHSLVGYLGIKFKTLLENIVGVQYPNGLPTIVTGKH